MTNDKLMQPTENTIKIKGTDLHYRESGVPNGAPVIVMHGWGCTLETMAFTERIASETCHVYNIDFPGFGKSTEPDEIWGVEEYTDMLHQFAVKLVIENPVLIGHSFGGRVALLYASLYPVSKVILVDAAGVKPLRSLKYYSKVYWFKTIKKLAPIFLGKERGAKWIEKQRNKRGSADYRNSSPKMKAIMSKVVNEDLCYAMPKIKAPTLLVWGEKDTATPMRDARIMEKLIPDAGLVSFPGCGHYSFLDNPRQYAAVIKSFLAS